MRVAWSRSIEALLLPLLPLLPLSRPLTPTCLGRDFAHAGLLSPSKRGRQLGVLLSAVLHFAIAITPHPNSVPTFGVVCMVRLFFVMPVAWAAALREAFTAPASATEAVGRIGAAALIAGSAVFTSTPGLVVDYAIVTQFALVLIGCRAIALDANAVVPEMVMVGAEAAVPPPATESKSALGGAVSERGRAFLRLGGGALLFVTFSYSFLSQPLGLMDMGAASPFASIRMHGGSNHLVMPTGLLQQWTATNKHDLLRGGVVRVTACDSAYLNALYPASCTDELLPRIKAILAAGGHLAQQWNPTARRALGLVLRMNFMYRWDASNGDAFVAYTLPALELRRALAEVRARNESFSIEYEHLPGLVGDETWRQSAVASQVRFETDGSAWSKCRSREAGSLFWGACAEEELALLPAPTGLMMKWMLFFAYPIVPGLEELPCMD